MIGYAGGLGTDLNILALNYSDGENLYPALSIELLPIILNGLQASNPGSCYMYIVPKHDTASKRKILDAAPSKSGKFYPDSRGPVEAQHRNINSLGPLGLQIRASVVLRYRYRHPSSRKVPL